MHNKTKQNTDLNKM